MGLTGDQVLGFVLLDIAIILVMARLMGKLANKLGQPAVVGEIVAGVILGPSVLGATIFTWGGSWEQLHCEAAVNAPGLATPPAESITTCFFPPQAQGILGVLGQIALVFFMFLVGLELDFDLLKGKAKSIALVAIGAVAVPIALGFVVGPIIFDDRLIGGEGVSESTFTLFVAAMLSVTAFPVMARILQEKKLTQSLMGATGVAAAAIVTVLMFLMVAVASGAASGASGSDTAKKFLGAAIFIAVLFLVVRPLLVPLGRRYEESGVLTPTMFASVVILMFASAYTAHQIGINVIVGGFLAGAVLPARVRLFRELGARLSDVTAIVLLPIFLAFSGLKTDFTQLGTEDVVPIAIFLAAGIVGKWLGSAVFARLGGLSWAEGNVLGILMNCRGLLVLVVALIGFTEGVISAPMQVAGVLMALVTTMMTGPLMDAFLPRVAPEAPKKTEPARTTTAGLAGSDMDGGPVARTEDATGRLGGP